MEQKQEIKQQTRIEPISWEAKEFDVPKRSIEWYIIISIILIALLVYTIYISYWILSAVIVVVSVVLYLVGSLKPRTMKYLINEAGIQIGDKVFSYDQLKTFWFSRSEDGIKLNLISTFHLMPVISIYVTKELENKIRETLIKVLPESKNESEDWVDRINRILKI